MQKKFWEIFQTFFSSILITIFSGVQKQFGTKQKNWQQHFS